MLQQQKISINKFSQKFYILLSLSIISVAPIFAESNADKLNSSSIASTASPISSANQNIDLALKNQQQQLKRMSEAIKRIRRGAADINGECTQPLEMTGEIDVIGQDVIPIMPMTAEGYGTQYLPPRPKYIKLHMDQLESLIPILQDEINSLVIADSEKEYATQPMQDINGNMGDLVQHFKTLQNLTKTDSYNQSQIANEARGLDISAKDIDIARKKLLHDDIKQDKIEQQKIKEQNKN